MTTLVTATSSSIEKGESLIDTGWTVDCIGADVIVMRHPNSGSAHLMSRYIGVPVVNAGDGMHQHPSQGLLDAMTILNHKKTLRGLRVVIVGDVYHSRVARSNAELLSRFGADVIFCGPLDFVPEVASTLAPGVTASHDLNSALQGADVVMALRVQKERLAGTASQRRGLHCAYQVTSQRMKLAKPDAILMHPGPVIRGMELTSEVADGPQSCIHEQVRNGVKTRMAILAMALGAADDMESLLIQRGHVIDPASGIDQEMDVLLRDGRVAEIAAPGKLRGQADKTFNARGLIVAPGLIDLHVHLREPGQSHKETIATGTAAAAAGGFTSVCAMPNTVPVNDSAEITAGCCRRSAARWSMCFPSPPPPSAARARS